MGHVQNADGLRNVDHRLHGQRARRHDPRCEVQRRQARAGREDGEGRRVRPGGHLRPLQGHDGDPGHGRVRGQVLGPRRGQVRRKHAGQGLHHLRQSRQARQELRSRGRKRRRLHEHRGPPRPRSRPRRDDDARTRGAVRHHREADSGHLRAVRAALRASHRRSPALRLQARGSAKVPSGGTRVLEHHIPVAPGEGGEPHRLGADQGLGPQCRPREGRPRVLPRLRADRDVGTARVGDGHARRRRGRDVRRGSADGGYQAADRASARRRRRREQQATRRARRRPRRLLHRHVLRVRVWLLGLLEGAPGEAGYGQAHTERGRGTDGDGGGDGRRAQALSEQRLNAACFQLIHHLRVCL